VVYDNINNIRKVGMSFEAPDELVAR